MDSAHAIWDVGITGHWFIGLVAAVTVGFGTATVVTWEWPRFKMLRRLCGFFGTQLMLTVTLAAVVNAQAGFYATTSELVAALGGSASSVRTVHVPTAQVGTIAPDRPGSRPWEHQHTAHQHGLILDTRIRGRSTGYDLPASIYLPSLYFDRRQPTRRFPVIELTDGYPGSPQLWLHTLALASMLNNLIEAHRIPPMIAVLPTQNPTPGRDSECVDSVGGVRADTYLGVDVPSAVAQQFRTARSRTGWAILGYSTGGFCAVNTALQHSAQFSAAASLSGYFSPLTDITTGDLYHGNTAARRNNTPLLTVRQRRTHPLQFYLFGSHDDHHEVTLDRAFAAKIRRPDQVTQAVATRGGHNFQTWDKALPQAFEWLGRTLHAP